MTSRIRTDNITIEASNPYFRLRGTEAGFKIIDLKEEAGIIRLINQTDIEDEIKIDHASDRVDIAHSIVLPAGKTIDGKDVSELTHLKSCYGTGISVLAGATASTIIGKFIATADLARVVRITYFARTAGAVGATGDTVRIRIRDETAGSDVYTSPNIGFPTDWDSESIDYALTPGNRIAIIIDVVSTSSTAAPTPPDQIDLNVYLKVS